MLTYFVNTFQDCKKLLSHPSFRQCSLDHDWEAGLGPEGLGSFDSSDLILASQGSLAGLELLAMRGSMRPNGSISNSVYVNPFNPSPRTNRSHKKHQKKLASRSRSNDLGSDLEFGSSLDNLELHHRFRKSRQHKVVLSTEIFKISTEILFSVGESASQRLDDRG